MDDLIKSLFSESDEMLWEMDWATAADSPLFTTMAALKLHGWFSGSGGDGVCGSVEWEKGRNLLLRPYRAILTTGGDGVTTATRYRFDHELETAWAELESAWKATPWA